MYCDPKQLEIEIAALKESGRVSEELTRILNEMFVGIGKKYGRNDFHWLEDHCQQSWVWFMRSYTKIECEGNIFSYITMGIINNLIQFKRREFIGDETIIKRISALHQQYCISNLPMNHLINLNFEELANLTGKAKPKRNACLSTRGLHELNGIKKSLREWASLHKLPESRVRTRMNRGWPLEKALTTPLKTKTA